MVDHIVVSADGTRIAAGVMGDGPPVVLVHGAIGDRTSFRLLAPLLADRFEVFTIDRRGHGASADGTGPYTIEQEFEDVVAIVDSIGGPVSVVGHSFGGTVAIGAAGRCTSIDRLVLYEPSPGLEAASPGFLDRLDALIAGDDRDAALELALVEFAGFGPDDIADYRATPLWEPRVRAAHTIAREVRAEAAFRPDRSSLPGLTASVLFIRGGESPDWAARGADVVQALAPTMRTVVLDGQGHMATVTAPDRLATEIIRFVSGAPSSAA